MKIQLCLQLHHCSSLQRQEEIHSCLASHLRHPGLDAILLWLEVPPAGAADAEDADGARVAPDTRWPDQLIAAMDCPVPLELIRLERRITYADWLRCASGHSDTILLLANNDIRFDHTLDQLAAWLPAPDRALALSRWETHPPDQPPWLRASPHWSQDVWAIRSDAPIDASLLHASAIPLGVPGCDNRIAHVLWSHGFGLANPCLQIRCLHEHRSDGRSYDRAAGRLFGACTYVHPALAPGALSELEHTIWSRQPERSGGLIVQVEGETSASQAFLAQAAGSGSGFLERMALLPLLSEGAPLGRGAVRLGEAAGTGQQATPLGATPQGRDRLVVPLGGSGLQSLQITLEPPARLLAVQLRLPPGWATAVIELQSLSTAGCWLPWQCSPPPDGDQNEAATLHLSLPPFAHRACRLALSLHRHGMAPRAQGGGEELLELMIIATSQAALIDAETPAATGSCVARYGKRFEVRHELGGTVWIDRFWPQPVFATAEPLPLPPLPDESEALFRRGFVRPLLEWKRAQVGASPGASQALLVWDPDDSTEEQAWRDHAALGEPPLEGDCCDLYIALPWSTFQRRRRAPERLLDAYGARVRAVAAVLADFGRSLRVHSVCQHRQWQDQLPLFQRTGITDLWLAHGPSQIQVAEGQRLHSWSDGVLLPAKEVQDALRRQRLAPELNAHARSRTCFTVDHC
ncbi:MAG: hypothetical protein VKI83_00305 [Synechococcaceae cyanobacterium]|nr:hypothetical protein [Synechococcaceae cyanobacterium]